MLFWNWKKKSATAVWFIGSALNLKMIECGNCYMILKRLNNFCSQCGFKIDWTNYDRDMEKIKK